MCIRDRLGIAAFTGASYNSILFSAVFVAEATGNVFLVVPSLVASAVAFTISAGASNSRSQRLRRHDWRDQLLAEPVSAVMTARVVTASPSQTLHELARAMVLDHHFRALPVVDRQGLLLGMVGLAQLRAVPEADWPRTPVADLLDAAAPTVTSVQPVADAEEALRRGAHGAVPVVEAGTHRLVGVVSESDLFRALGAGPAPRR